MASENKAVVLGLNEALVIAALPALGYWMAFLYQLGYCKYFDIPPEFIDITVLNVLVAIVGAAFAFGTIQFFVDPFLTLSHTMPAPLRFSALKMLAIAIFLGGWLLITKINAFLVLFVIGFYGVMLFFEFVYPLIAQKKVKGYSNKLKAQTEADGHTRNTFDLIGDAIGTKGMVTALTLWALSILVYFAGGIEAKLKSDFMVVGYTTKSVVLKSVGDMYVAARFNAASKDLFAEFTLVSRKEDLEFTNERIGPLNPLGPKRREP